MRNLLIIGIAAGLAVAASADISTSLVPVAGAPAGMQSYDLVGTVDAGDDWTSTAMKASISGGSFYNDALGGNSQPNPALFPFAPNLPWDTFATQPEGWPNTPGQGAGIGFAGTPNFLATSVDATWFDTPTNGGGGSWVLARLTVTGLQTGWVLKVDGTHTTVKGQATLFPFSFTVPEPSSLSLLVLGGVAALIRRR